MSRVNIDAGKTTRKEHLLLWELDKIIVDPSLRGRQKVPSSQDVAGLAKSILEKGQLQPVLVRRIADKKVQLVFGYTRYEAVKLLRSQGHDIPLKAEVTTMNDQEAFVANVIENKERNVTSFVDDAFNQRRLREQLGWETAKIAELYRCTEAWVSQLTKLLNLDQPILDRVHCGELSVTAALDLANLDTTEQHAVLAMATEVAEQQSEDAKLNGRKKQNKVTGSAVKKAMRAVGKGSNHNLSLKEVRDFFESLTGPAEEDKELVALCKEFGKFLAGKLTEQQMENRLRKFRQQQ